MLSYQHAFHAGNLADLHKHALLAAVLDYVKRKPKPITYIETHAGRGLYHLDGAQALKTGEAQAGIARAEAEGWLRPDHPLLAALRATRLRHGAQTYPGSPLLAAHFIGPGDSMHLAELHPTEYEALQQNLPGAHLYRQDGFQMAQAICPPMPRRGLLLIDPSYEVKADYDRIPGVITRIRRKWNVGVVMLWYPVLTDGRHRAMTDSLQRAHQDAILSEVSFAPARPGHSMIGSGMFIANPPWGTEDAVAEIRDVFTRAV